MSSLTEEEWWESLEPDFPYEKDITPQSKFAKPHERTALWAYLQASLPVTEAASRLMVIKAEDWDVHEDICNDCGIAHKNDEDGGEFDKSAEVAELLFQVAMARPKTIPRILNLIDAIEALPPYELNDEQKARCPEWKDWSVRSSWEFTVREAYCSWNNDDEYFGDTKNRNPLELGLLELLARRLASMNMLMAYEVVRKLDPDKLPSSRNDQIGYGLRSLGQALEHDAWNNPYRILGNRPRIQMFDFRGLNELIIIATPWLMAAGHILYRCLDREEFQDWDPSEFVIHRFGVFAYLYRGKPGLCFDRWNFWKSRLEWIQGTDLTEKAKLAAKEALQRMEAIEKDRG